ncbi:uncharacterized protein [Linepithema humile]|uniref:uncharacterized protein n=1 Tax=Linepithema humile TaxID=83485 RepID=UPI00351F7DEE
MSKKNVISNMQHKNKCSMRTSNPKHPASKDSKETFIHSSDILQDISVNANAASASTSNERILLLSETERKHNKSFHQNYPDMKNNNTCERASSSLDKHDKSCIQKNVSLSTQNNSKNFISIEVNNSDKVQNGKTDAKIIRKNKVPVSSKLVISQNVAHETESIPVCNNASDTIAKEKNDTNAKRINLNNMTKTFSKKQQGKINDCVASSDLSQKILITDDNILSTKTQDKIVKEQHCTLSNKKTVAGSQRVKEIKSKITATAKPTSSLPSDLLSSIEDNNEKLKSVKVENNLPVSAQLSTDKTQLDGDPRKLAEECTVYDQEKLVKQQTSSRASHDDTDLKSILHKDTRETTEINVKQNEQNQLSVPTIKRKRGRPRKVDNNSIDQNTPTKSKNDDTSQEIPAVTEESMTRSKRSTSRIKITTNISDSSDGSDTADVEYESFVKKRGRPVGSRGRGRRRGRGRGRKIVENSLDKEYIPKFMRNDVSQSKTVESDNVDLDNTNTTGDLPGIDTENDATDATNEGTPKHLITCSRCNQQISRRQWSSHNLYQHNNMAWREDEEPLDFENDVKLLKKVLTFALKKKKTYLTCEKCEATKRSVQGFISHMQFCGKSEEERQALMVTCPICNSVMMPSSVEIHERYHRQLEQNQNRETPIIQIERTKRKAAEKAVPKIMEFAKSMKDPCTTNQMKSKPHSFLKNLIQMPELKKRIPSIWKSQWKKELIAKGIASCKQEGCTYTCSSYENICEHHSQCNFIPQENFICKVCKFLTNSQDKMVDHIMEVHPDNQDIEKCSDFEKDNEDSSDSSDESVIEFNVKQRHRSSRITHTQHSDITRILNKIAFVDQVPFQKPQSRKMYKPSLDWTMEFERKNYELTLFNDLMPNSFTLLRSDDAAKYLPELITSMPFKYANANSSKKGKSDNSDWKHIGRFESNFYEGIPTFFVGGPIWALAWLPIPSPMYTKNPTQYVAISTHPAMENKYTIGKEYSSPNIIQIWDIGSLDHEVQSTNKLPTLAYAIAHNSGTVWCLEWCPSGCYQDIDLHNSCKTEKENKLKRMGLLAAACSDGCVNIYSLPFAEELEFEKTEHNSWPIYKTDPVITLVVNHLMYDNNKQNWQCTKLSWTKEHGHSIIAAGFTNGYIALWHLTTTSFLLLNVRNNTKFINASQHFFAHHNAVTMVALIPYMNGRYLASASLDRSYKFWDLEDTSAPQNSTKKGIITDGIWMTNWPCVVLSFDDALGYKYTHSYIIPLREYGYKYCSILPTNTPTYGITVSDFANSIAHGTLAGEVITIFPHQLLYSEKLLIKKRQLSSCIEIVDFLEEQQDTPRKVNKNKNDKNSKDYHYMPETYNECKNRFGIVFHDNLMDLKKNISRGEDTLDNNKLMSFPIEQYPFTSANKVAWNPNIWSYLWLMVGYQSGLVRLLNFKHMSNELNDNSLSSHVNHLLTKGNNSI